MHLTPNWSQPATWAEIPQQDAKRALAEDVGSGDLTAALVPAHAMAQAQVVLRQDAVLCGAPWVEAAAQQVHPAIACKWAAAEGQACQAGTVVLGLEGPAAALLTLERTALNFLQMLSAVATHTAAFVHAVRGSGAAIVDTRKTLPGLRLAQKYAVWCGGGTNHRMGLHDAVLIKENHIAAAGGVAQALRAAAAQAAKAEFVQIEVETLEQLDEALHAGATMVLLDNMDLPTLRQAVARNQGRAVLEISGGVTLEQVGALAAVGVDRISVGTLTKDIRAVDLSMRFTKA
jgi:nicotinate-nucleotide pyrophosphorylase (carboxylating)